MNDLVKNPRIIEGGVARIFLIRLGVLVAALIAATVSRCLLLRAATAPRGHSCQTELKFSFCLDNRKSAVISRTEVLGDL